jgi:Uma2 family endonuclease
MSAAALRLRTAADLLGEYAERGEIVGGDLAQKALPDFEHGQAQGTLRASLDPYRSGRGGPGGWWLATEVRVQFELHEVYLPDISGWRKDRHPARPVGRPVLAVPDWVCEVLSDSTRRKDLRQKLPVYHRQQVGHVWLVDPDVRAVQVYRWAEPGFVLVDSGGLGDVLRAEPFPEAGIDIADLFGVPDDEVEALKVAEEIAARREG